MIVGLEQVVSQMLPGEEVQALIPSDLAYGEKGVCTDGGECLIDPNTNLKVRRVLPRGNAVGGGPVNATRLTLPTHAPRPTDPEYPVLHQAEECGGTPRLRRRGGCCARAPSVVRRAEEAGCSCLFYWLFY